MPLNSTASHIHIHNYPKIQIDKASVIKPCVADQAAADQFINRTVGGWRKLFHDTHQEGPLFLLTWLANIQITDQHSPSNSLYIYLVKFIKHIALFLLHIHSVYLYIYGYFYPYSLLSADQLCNEFSRCPNWTGAIIRAFAWHPNQDRCALAISNDYVYVYQGPTRIRVLRHNLQRKITDLAWQPSDKEVLVVATQTSLLFWRVSENPNGLMGLDDNSRRNFASLAPRLQLIQRQRENIKSTNDPHPAASLVNGPSTPSNTDNFKIIHKLLPAPIISIQFDKTGDRVIACSPNSSRIAMVNVTKLLNLKSTEKCDICIEYIGQFGQGITRLLHSPLRNRLAASTTSVNFKVFETFKWTCNKWTLSQDIIQDMVWSGPQGRMLLIAYRNQPVLYALPFLDDSQPGDVGGNQSLTRALDLTATTSESGDTVGGCVQAFAWDKQGRRLAISFKDNPESILLYKTVERPTLEFHQLGVLKSDNSSHPLLMSFHDKFKDGSLLTICWSDGTCQHMTFSHTSNEQARNHVLGEDRANGSFNQTKNSFAEANNSVHKTPRSLTNFCHISGNNSISSYSSSLLPINKVQQQTTLFSLNSRSPLMENNQSLNTTND